ncbi:phosphopantetheine-binding protein [Chitinophaga sp. YIM B06452]|uniref:acyl carrier protein n=1 Tax=Chitinophaga sp. YIM B06452 TaxID=3082158 RepID=UPI0031FE90A2
MELQEFVKKFEEQLDDLEPGTLTADTRFRELSEWDSMSSLAVIAMVDHEMKRQISGDDILNSNTIADLYNNIRNK